MRARKAHVNEQVLLRHKKTNRGHLPRDQFQWDYHVKRTAVLCGTHTTDHTWEPKASIPYTLCVLFDPQQKKCHPQQTLCWFWSKKLKAVQNRHSSDYPILPRVRSQRTTKLSLSLSLVLHFCLLLRRGAFMGGRLSFASLSVCVKERGERTSVPRTGSCCQQN